MKPIPYKQVLNEIGTSVSHLLLGNGFSISYNPIFSYQSLYKVAVEYGLSDKAISVFEKLGTNNFEGVLKLLENVAWVSQIYYDIEDGGQVILNDIAIIKEALIQAIAKSHLANTGEVSAKAKESAIAFLGNYKTVFTTNYDLLLYWVNMHSNPYLFGDCFRAEHENPDAEYVIFSEHLKGANGILFLHGALHLYFENGYIKKHCWSRTKRPLIELIREGLDNKKYPLFVAEGTPQKKLEQINSNAYLAYCLAKLGRVEKNLVIFGNTLGGTDEHIADVIADNKDITNIYVGIYGDPEFAINVETFAACERIISRRKSITDKLKKPKILSLKYFDSGSVNVWKKYDE